MDGVLRCSRYAFGPNRLHYCGPDANQEILAYMKEGMSDPGLEALLGKFRTMYPYLRDIARANNIKNSFDGRVVEAYWIGNRLLEKMQGKSFYLHLLEKHELKKRIGKKAFGAVTAKIEQGALPHHSFHVFNIWKRTGHVEDEHALESIDACRISWGTVQKIDGPHITVKIRPIVIQNGALAMGKPMLKKIVRELEISQDFDDIKPGSVISIHWGVPCEIITPGQAMRLEHYTNMSIQFANQTL